MSGRLCLFRAALDVERGLRQGRSYPADTKKGWHVFTNACSDGKNRPYHVYVPKGYDPARKHPAIVSLHGGVGRPNLLPENLVNQIRAELEQRKLPTDTDPPAVLQDLAKTPLIEKIDWTPQATHLPSSLPH